jgi:hypothetical protein
MESKNTQRLAYLSRERANVYRLMSSFNGELYTILTNKAAKGRKEQ